jgi:hypothetical protein
MAAIIQSFSHLFIKRANRRSERRATIVDFSYVGCGIRMVVESCRGADRQGLCPSSV